MGQESGSLEVSNLRNSVKSGAIMLYRGSEFRRYSVSPKWARGEGWNSEGVDAQSLKSHEILLNFAN